MEINEEEQREALKGFYERCDPYIRPLCNKISSKAEEQGVKTERRLRRATIVAHYISPTVATTFAVVYWMVGMFNVMYPDMQEGI